MQAEKNGFPQIAIGKVGVRNIELPIRLTKKGDPDSELGVMATMSSYCDLVEDLKGINMSRIERTLVPAFLGKSGAVTDLSKNAVYELQKAHDTDHIYLKVKFKYAIDNSSPVTEIHSPEIANIEIESKLNLGEFKQYITVEMVGMSLCPCSKEMSLLYNNLDEKEKKFWKHLQQLTLDPDNEPEIATFLHKAGMAGFGAHNQKSFVKVTVELNPDKQLYFEDIIGVINKSVSAPTYAVLKRPDEKYVTEVSYMGGYFDEDHKLQEVAGYGPKFVEDIARQVADNLNESFMGDSINDYVIVVRNQESIHSQDIEAVAVLDAGKYLK